MKRNYQKELEKILEKENPGKCLLLHSCCAPCSSYVLIYLRQFFRITVFYYNPNITFSDEYEKRVAEQKRLITALNASPDGGFPIEILEGSYEPERFLRFAGEPRFGGGAHIGAPRYRRAAGMRQGTQAQGHAHGPGKCPEGGERCHKCFELRLSESAKQAKLRDYDYFTTTLTISPLKNAEKLNEIGEQMAQEYGVTFLPSDFKKKNGYLRSCRLSEEYKLYRQEYCGCIYSKTAADIRKKTVSTEEK